MHVAAGADGSGLRRAWIVACLGLVAGISLTSVWEARAQRQGTLHMHSEDAWSVHGTLDGVEPEDRTVRTLSLRSHNSTSTSRRSATQGTSTSRRSPRSTSCDGSSSRTCAT